MCYAKVYEEATGHFGTVEALIMGDFNADCRYAKPDQLQQLTLYKDMKRYSWKLGRVVQTDPEVASNVHAKTSCLYDV